MLVKFEAYYDGEYWCARGIGVDIFTQGKTLDELTENIKEAASLHFEDILETGEELKMRTLKAPCLTAICRISSRLDFERSLRYICSTFAFSIDQGFDLDWS
jgi:hypothetical protein